MREKMVEEYMKVAGKAIGIATAYYDDGTRFYFYPYSTVDNYKLLQRICHHRISLPETSTRTILQELINDKLVFSQERNFDISKVCTVDFAGSIEIQNFLQIVYHRYIETDRTRAQIFDDEYVALSGISIAEWESSETDEK